MYFTRTYKLYRQTELPALFKYKIKIYLLETRKQSFRKIIIQLQFKAQNPKAFYCANSNYRS